MMTATANINDNGRTPFVRGYSDGVTAVRCLNQPQTITFNLSKRLAQSWGQDRKHVFKNNKDISCIKLCDSVAFLSILRNNSCAKVEDYNPCKLRNAYERVTGVRMNTRTIEGYIYVLQKFDLCRIEHGTLYFSKIRSNSKQRNFKIEYKRGDSIKTVGRKIAEHVVSAPMRAIGYIWELKRRLQDPKDFDELERTQSRAKRLNFDIERFRDNGVSYSTIAKRLNTSRSYVIEIVKRCEENGVVRKFKRRYKETYSKASRRFLKIGKFLSSIADKYTYHFYDSIKDRIKLFLVRSNIYVYNPYNLDALSYAF